MERENFSTPVVCFSVDPSTPVVYFSVDGGLSDAAE
jgi:hypothetical protein